MADGDTKEIEVAGIRFTVASRPQTRYSAVQTVNNLTATSFAPIQLPATGFVRKIRLAFTQTATFASTGAVVAGDGPFNLIPFITITDATGQPIVQPISGYTLSRKNKYSKAGIQYPTIGVPWGDPQLGPRYQFSSTATTATVTFDLDLDFEQDRNNGWGCIPNLDSNASLQMRIDAAAYTNALTGTTPSNTTLSVRLTQYYWAPIGSNVGGLPAVTQPAGVGDFLETRWETQTVNAASENTINLTNRGGLIKNIIVVSRTSGGVRTAFTAGSNVGLIVDNNPVDEGVLLEEHQDRLRRSYGYIGTDITTSYAPLTAGTLPGLDTGVLAFPFWLLSGGRDSWLKTRTGSLVQLKLTPGASATTLEIMTEIAQVEDSAAFFAPSSLTA